VYVFLHGGAFEQGTGDCGLYDASTLASTGLVVVVPNYRLGVSRGGGRGVCWG
jgi:carboxylesterase type B